MHTLTFKEAMNIGTIQAQHIRRHSSIHLFNRKPNDQYLIYLLW